MIQSIECNNKVIHEVPQSTVGPIHTLEMMLHVRKDFLEEMPTELNLEEFVERIILEMRKKIPGRRTSTCKKSLKTDKRLIIFLLLMSLYTGKPKYKYNINVVVRIVGIKRKKAATGIY